MDRSEVQSYFEQLQQSICDAVEKLDGDAEFEADRWQRDEGGGGKTRVMQDGALIEKGGVNFSAVYGPLPTKIARKLEVPATDFYATGVSIVLHPVHPMVPIIHMNVRYFQLKSGEQWFGGGIDLTPHYIDKKETRFFHQKLKAVCDAHHPVYYPKFKKWADDYFYIKHREETRGVGGIFFDRLSVTEEFSIDQRFAFVRSVGDAFIPIYETIVDNKRGERYGEEDKKWQHIRRGRYVEFNLVYDKGTKFGLDTGGRVESILMSLPAVAGWPYNYRPEKGSGAWETQQLLKKGIDWIHEK